MKRKKKNKNTVLRVKILPAPWAMGVIILLVLGVYTFIQGARYLIEQTDLFLLKKIEVTGNRYIDREDILSRVKLELNQPLYQIDPRELTKELLQNKYIRAVSISRNLPGTLVIDVQERQPVFYLIDKYIYMVDESGIILKKLPTMPINKIPVVTGLKVAQLLKERTPVWRTLELLKKIQEVDKGMIGMISEIHFGDKTWPELYLIKGGARVNIGSEFFYTRLYVLSELLHNPDFINQLENIKRIDLTFDNRVIVEQKS